MHKVLVCTTSLMKIGKAIASYRLRKQRSAFVCYANLLVFVPLEANFCGKPFTVRFLRILSVFVRKSFTFHSIFYQKFILKLNIFNFNM